jgi:hypothetical protein
VIAAIRTWVADARAWQQQALADLSALDDACTSHMAHGAMAGADPLTDSLYSQLEAPAAEGAQQPTPYPDGMQPQRESRAWWLAGATLLAALAGLCFFPR